MMSGGAFAGGAGWKPEVVSWSCGGAAFLAGGAGGGKMASLAGGVCRSGQEGGGGWLHGGGGPVGCWAEGYEILWGGSGGQHCRWSQPSHSAPRCQGGPRGCGRAAFPGGSAAGKGRVSAGGGWFGGGGLLSLSSSDCSCCASRASAPVRCCWSDKDCGGAAGVGGVWGGWAAAAIAAFAAVVTFAWTQACLAA